MQLLKGNRRDPCGNGDGLHLDYMNLVLAVMLSMVLQDGTIRAKCVSDL